MKSMFLSALLLAAVAVFHGTTAEAASDEVYSAPKASELHQDVLTWIEQRGLTETPVIDAIAPMWEFNEEPNAAQLFETLMRTFYLADDQVRAIVDRCRESTYVPGQLTSGLPSDDDLEPLLTHNVRYFVARHLATLTAYDEAAELLHRTDPNFVVDPAGSLFHQAVCDHHLLNREPGLEALTRLLDQTETVPVRYQKLGALMREDLEQVKEKTLGEVARQMKDVERRLNLGRADEDTQEVERKIIATLDELIKKAEEQQQQQQQQSAGGGQSRPNKGAEESYLGGIKGEGLTDKKKIGHKDNWGDLPPKAREAAKNQLDRQFPAHYRRAVEEYLKKLAERPGPGS